MTNAYGNHDQTPKKGVEPETPDHQREDQPLKELNEDPEDARNGTDDVDKQNAQGDHAGSAHDPAAFTKVDPAARHGGK